MFYANIFIEEYISCQIVGVGGKSLRVGFFLTRLQPISRHLLFYSQFITIYTNAKKCANIFREKENLLFFVLIMQHTGTDCSPTPSPLSYLYQAYFQLQQKVNIKFSTPNELTFFQETESEEKEEATKKKYSRSHSLTVEEPVRKVSFILQKKLYKH